jgi:hypothetical protein
MFATIKSLIPEPRQADQPRRYVGRHRQPEALIAMPSPEDCPPLPVAPGPAKAAEPVIEPVAAQATATEPVAVESTA